MEEFIELRAGCDDTSIFTLLQLSFSNSKRAYGHTIVHYPLHTQIENYYRK